MEDLIDNFNRLIHAFKAHGLKPPVAIELDSVDEGMRFISAVHDASARIHYGSFIDDNKTWGECHVGGLAVRWPATLLPYDHKRQIIKIEHTISNTTKEQ